MRSLLISFLLALSFIVNAQKSSLRNGSLFKNFNWDHLLERKLKSPFIPRNLREWKNNLNNIMKSFESYIAVKLYLLYIFKFN